MINTYLFSWNPVKWPWPTLGKDVEKVKRGQVLRDKWSCASHRSIRPGDRAFFVKVAHGPRGIFGSGYVVSDAFPEESEKTGKQVYRVYVTYDVLIDPGKNGLLALDILTLSDLRRQNWTPQSAGISVRPELVPELEAVWNDFLLTRNIIPLELKKHKWK